MGWGSIGDVVELVELLCLAFLSTTGEGGKTEGGSWVQWGNCFGTTIRTGCEDESWCQRIGVSRSAQ